MDDFCFFPPSLKNAFVDLCVMLLSANNFGWDPKDFCLFPLATTSHPIRNPQFPEKQYENPAICGQALAIGVLCKSKVLGILPYPEPNVLGKRFL